MVQQAPRRRRSSSSSPANNGSSGPRKPATSANLLFTRPDRLGKDLRLVSAVDVSRPAPRWRGRRNTLTPEPERGGPHDPLDTASGPASPAEVIGVPAACFDAEQWCCLSSLDEFSDPGPPRSRSGRVDLLGETGRSNAVPAGHGRRPVDLGRTASHPSRAQLQVFHSPSSPRAASQTQSPAVHLLTRSRPPPKRVLSGRGRTAVVNTEAGPRPAEAGGARISNAPSGLAIKKQRRGDPERRRTTQGVQGHVHALCRAKRFRVPQGQHPRLGRGPDRPSGTVHRLPGR